MKRVGWVLAAVCWTAGAPLRAEVPTFNRDISPILWKNCAGCHRSGEVGPFPLLTYRDAAKRADFLAEVTVSRRMPPWKPEPGFGAFLDEHRLSDEDIRRIAEWSEAGAPEGDPADLKPLPTFPEGWQLGKPDLVLEVPERFEIPATGRDVYRCFVIPIPIDFDRTVAAVEFRPGNRRVVHHALLYLDTTGAARSRDADDPGPGYTTFGGPGILPTGMLGGWAPGAMPRRLPDGVGRYLRKGSDLVLQVHYHPDGKPETDRSVVGVYFTPTPARKIVAGIAVRTRDIDIPPGESRYRASAQSEPLPVDVHAIGISPHMHYVGREMKVVARTPEGRTVPLIWIKDWDFNWQGQYQFRSPVDLPKGTVITVEAFYDNSADNPANPSKPPRRVRWGEQTTDEMCLLGVQVVTDNLADLRKIIAMRGNRLGAAPSGGVLPTVPIPDRFKETLGRYDTDGDGKLSAREIDAMPEGLAERVRAAIRRRLGADQGRP